MDRYKGKHMKEYIEFIKKFVSEKNDMELDEIDIKKDMFEEGYLDSLSAYRLLLELDVKFSKTIPQEFFLERENFSIFDIAEVLDSL